jgi:hypothetical protein
MARCDPDDAGHAPIMPEVATVVATAERLKITRILTTDRRDFSLVRPRHCSAFELLP